MRLAITYRPLSSRTWLRPPGQRSNSRFRAAWPATQELLDTELRHLGGKNVVLGLDVPEQSIRVDGRGLLAHTVLATPGVEIAFDSTHGPLVYRCDEFGAGVRVTHLHWQDNVRAIALTLQALRAVDRYGSSHSGEQYAGYRQIAADPEKLTSAAALEIVLAAAGATITDYGPELNSHLPSIWAKARRNTHPDRGGPRAEWDKVERAGITLGLI